MLFLNPFVFTTEVVVDPECPDYPLPTPTAVITDLATAIVSPTPTAVDTNLCSEII